ncbi:MAG: LuxR C-terminal-related transcriptional regulator [Actinomycetota bacterium]
MSGNPEASLNAGQAALAEGRWSAAKASFQEALDLYESAEALSGLGEALWWLGETHDSVAFRERAYAEFRRRPEPVQATNIALGLCVHYQANMANKAVSAGWLARAKRLVDEFELDDFRGWLLLLEAGEADDPALAEERARQAQAIAGDSQDLDLELCALAQRGSAVIKQGRIDEGLVLLDEAMAGSLGGEGGNFETVVFTSCEMIDSCARCADFERAVQWIGAADRFTQHYGCPFLYIYCRTLYGSVLTATGAWELAERELRTALRQARASQPALKSLAAATLAELRIAQGRIEEAERLLAGVEEQLNSTAAVAMVHVARKQFSLAESNLRRGLTSVEGNELQNAVLRELLGEVEIARGKFDDAVAAGRRLATSGGALNCRLIVARGERLWGHALIGSGDVQEGRVHLEKAFAEFVRLGMPFERARTQLMLAEALLSIDPDVSTGEAGSALTTFEDLGAGTHADRAAALLRRLGVKAARAGPKGFGALTKREVEVLTLLGEGLSNPQIAERLYLSRKTVEHHVAAILSKLGARNRAEAVAAAIRLEAKSAAE